MPVRVDRRRQVSGLGRRALGRLLVVSGLFLRPGEGDLHPFGQHLSVFGADSARIARAARHEAEHDVVGAVGVQEEYPGVVQPVLLMPSHAAHRGAGQRRHRQAEGDYHLGPVVCAFVGEPIGTGCPAVMP